MAPAAVIYIQCKYSSFKALFLQIISLINGQLASVMKFLDKFNTLTLLLLNNAVRRGFIYTSVNLLDSMFTCSKLFIIL